MEYFMGRTRFRSKRDQTDWTFFSDVLDGIFSSMMMMMTTTMTMSCINPTSSMKLMIVTKMKNFYRGIRSIFRTTIESTDKLCIPITNQNYFK